MPAASSRFLDIERVVDRVVSRTSADRVESLQQLLDVDVHARALAKEALAEV